MEAGNGTGTYNTVMRTAASERASPGRGSKSPVSRRGGGDGSPRAAPASGSGRGAGRALVLACRAALIAAVLAGVPARGQDLAPSGSTESSVVALHAESQRAFARGDWAGAEAALRRVLERSPEDFVALYNLACARALQGDAPQAADLLNEAVAAGFADLGQLQSDPHLEGVREQAAYRSLVSEWAARMDAQRDRRIEREREFFNDGAYAVEIDARLRLAYLSAFDAGSLAEARREIDLLSEWAGRHVFEPGDIADAAADPWVVVVLPSPRDFQRYLAAEFGAADDPLSGQGIGGNYSHDDKRLVARDLGATLRHEYFHVLHWRANMRRGHVHAPWVQEGLCSLVEDYEMTLGVLTPVPSWRTNIVKRLEQARRLPTLEQLCRMSRDRFVGSRPLATYAHARAVFLYLYQKGRLKEWLRAYDAGFAEDATGLAAFERALAMPAAEVDRDFRVWVRALPMVPEQVRQGSASLGVEVEPGDGDGPRIVGVNRRPGQPRIALRLGDVITAIDGRTTRDMQELVRVLGDYTPGETVEVGYRRGRLHGTAEVTLVPR